MNGKIVAFGDLKSTGFERSKPAVGGAGAFRKHHDRAALAQDTVAMAHHGSDALGIPAPKRDIVAEAHIPADDGYMEILRFGDPLEMCAQPEEHEDIEQRKMIRDEHRRLRRDESFLTVHANGPSGIQPSVERGPK